MGYLKSNPGRFRRFLKKNVIRRAKRGATLPELVLSNLTAGITVESSTRETRL